MLMRAFFAFLALTWALMAIMLILTINYLNVGQQNESIYVHEDDVIDGAPILLENSTTPDNPTDPPYSASYLLYDNFSYDSGRWAKRDNTWSSSYAYTVFKPSNVWHENGNLVLRSYVNNHTGGEYKSDDKYFYGKYRASIKVDQTPGTYQTFYSYQWPTGILREGHNEIDIEIQKADGKYTALFSTWVKGVKSRYMYYMPFDPSEDYHTYGYDWYPDRVEFYIDDMSKPIWTSRSNVPAQPMYVYFQNWVQRDVPADHGGGVNTEYVDWVTVEPL
ncbi:Beta-glucanase/Beta-glucan synthetase [Methanocella conradii HZ254]|uniref:Beta-glucanase/Beta-glucan synthetase n=2 Tax=Methanocella TaxID=570266 RepID=H8I5J2_METCZ|nr:Beta-glucanase/Beta-glucan synthetase [Methanocella conradii HZ254]